MPIAARLIAHLATTYAMTFLHRQTFYAICDDHDRQHIERTVALTRTFTTWQACDIVTEARERCGAHAMFPYNGIAGLAPALDGAITAEGDNLPIR
ncbi:hypothetical protein [Streptomyces nigrescens]|uniref:acyl-CoA dehydrogenase family protein n=1 Tax=Streptomyces nigrescens TaxID=1920 RepID=UPI0021C2B845|nr:hypothetical protein [Streptomyces nigrescens]